MGTKTKDIYIYVLAALVVIAVISVVVLLIFHPMPLDNKDALMLGLGVLVAKFGDVIGYFFGSSKGSADKTALLSQSPKPPQDPPQP